MEEFSVRLIRRLCVWPGALLLLALCAGIVTAVTDPVDEIFFTKVNIWFENKDKIPSTNYHRGTILPVGAKVKITYLADGMIDFTDEAAQVTYSIVQIEKHTPGKLRELFDRYFSEKDIRPAMTRLSEDERKNIKEGKVAEGMSKDAVVMAYGYPPGHRTPTLTADEWIYWVTKNNTLEVRFRDGKVIEAVPGKGFRL